MTAAIYSCCYLWLLLFMGAATCCDVKRARRRAKRSCSQATVLAARYCRMPSEPCVANPLVSGEMRQAPPPNCALGPCVLGPEKSNGELSFSRIEMGSLGRRSMWHKHEAPMGQELAGANWHSIARASMASLPIALLDSSAQAANASESE